MSGQERGMGKDKAEIQFVSILLKFGKMNYSSINDMDE